MNFKIFIVNLFTVTILLAILTLASVASAADKVTCPDVDGFVIIGEVENISIQPEGLRLKARIDTGAETSSLGVIKQQPFERDGKNWLHFSVKDPVNEKLIDFEMPVVRIAEIKRHGAAPMTRPVVKLKIVLNDIEMEREFTLADRSKYTYPALIGRNVLSGQFMVDVNRKFSAKPAGGKEE